MIEYIEGDLFADVPRQDDDCVIIAHCCNNIGAWGAGFVVPLGKKYPTAKSSYLELSQRILGQTQFIETFNSVFVANMIGQEGIGPKIDENNKLVPPIRYEAIRSCMEQVAAFAKELKLRQMSFLPNPKVRIVCPLFGAGLAGGDWNIIEKMIISIWDSEGINVNIYYLSQFLPNNWTPQDKINV
jgi:hypothetical protein